MSELVAFVFSDQFRAPEVLNELRRRDWVWVRDLDEAVAVTVDEDGKARVHFSVGLSSDNAGAWARLWSSLLRTTLFIPLTEVMVDATDGLAFAPKAAIETSLETNESTRETEWWRESLEESNNFRRDVAALLAPSGSAIFMLLRSANGPTVLKQLRNYGDTILHTSLSPEQDEKMVTILATSKEGQSSTKTSHRKTKFIGGGGAGGAVSER